MNKSIEHYNGIQGNAVNFTETQHFINTLVGDTENKIVLYNDSSYDYAVENSLNHINLDISDDAIHSQDIVSTRIFPNKNTNRSSYTVEPILFDSEKVKELSVFLYKRTQVLSTKVLNLTIEQLIAFDAYCEEQLQKFLIQVTVISQTISNIAANAPKKEVTYAVKVPKPVSSQKKYTISVQEYSAVQYLEVPISFTSKISKTEEVPQAIPQDKKEGMIMSICSLIYSELRYGGTLENIDSV
jgi:hypothetical protein